MTKFESSENVLIYLFQVLVLRYIGIAEVRIKNLPMTKFESSENVLIYLFRVLVIRLYSHS